MDETNERRREQRLSYQWPIWFAEDFAKAVSQGLMVDVSSGGMAFTCNASESCPQPGQRLITRFSIPRLQADEFSDMTSFTRTARVCRVEKVNRSLCRVAVQFDEPLSLKPCEQASIDLMRSQSSTL
jgi:hypothetical protein